MEKPDFDIKTDKGWDDQFDKLQESYDEVDTRARKPLGGVVAALVVVGVVGVLGIWGYGAFLQIFG